MQNKELWVLIYDHPCEIEGGGKIVASFGSVIIYDALDFGLEHTSEIIKCTGKCYAQDLSGYPNENTPPQFFLTQEDLAKEIQSIRTFLNKRKTK